MALYSRDWCWSDDANCNNNRWRHLFQRRACQNTRIFIFCMGDIGNYRSFNWCVFRLFFKLAICVLDEYSDWIIIDVRNRYVFKRNESKRKTISRYIWYNNYDDWHYIFYVHFSRRWKFIAMEFDTILSHS